jgi:hypothetical protein
MEEAPENGKESLHSAHANAMEWNGMNISLRNIMDISNCNKQNITISVIE